MKQVLCMKWGTLYGPEYVNILYAMVRRNVSGELRFVCLTDDDSGVRPEVECLPCPTIDVPEPFNRASWRKVTLYRPSGELFGLEGDWLFLDLDVVVTGPLDAFFTYEPAATFVPMHNWTQKGQGIGQTSCFRFRVGAHTDLPGLLEARAGEIVGHHTNEQIFVSQQIGTFPYWPDDWYALFKVQCVPAWPQRFWKEPVLPAGARVVAFPGVPNPPQAIRGEWPVKKPWKRLYKYARPAGWVADHWRE